ncbi:hypothetical protein MPSEU_000269800 [Mayamaea pseudoterrestris]|nr:hypothetical protein MPSEU_000269800 [Mayamaea pseudoterrestris]
MKTCQIAFLGLLALLCQTAVHGFVHRLARARGSRPFRSLKQSNDEPNKVMEPISDHPMSEPKTVISQMTALPTNTNSLLSNKFSTRSFIDAKKAFQWMDLTADYLIFVMVAFLCATVLLISSGYAYTWTADGFIVDSITHIREQQDFQNEVWRLAHDYVTLTL